MRAFVTIITCIAILSVPAFAKADTSQGHIGAGFAYFGYSNHKSGIDMSHNYGLAIDFSAGSRLHENWGINFYGAWGMTEFKRTEDWFNRAVEGGEWTTKAFEDVTNEVGRSQYGVLLAIPAFFAYVFLAMTYLFEGLAILGSPAAATTYMLGGPTASFHIGNSDVAFRADLGIAAIVFITPDPVEMLGGFGPIAGVSLDFWRMNFGVRALYSPPETHGRPQDRESHVLAISTTLSYKWD